MTPQLKDTVDMITKIQERLAVIEKTLRIALPEYKYFEEGVARCVEIDLAKEKIKRCK